MRELVVSICELLGLGQWYHCCELPVSCCVLMVRSARNIHSDTAKRQSREPKSAEKASLKKNICAQTGTKTTRMKPEWKFRDQISGDAYSLWYKDEELEKNLDFDFLVDTPESAVNAVYIVNPEYLIYFGDLITDILSRVQEVTNKGLRTKHQHGVSAHED